MSASVVKRPKVMRKVLCASASLRPRARSTWLGCRLALWQAADEARGPGASVSELVRWVETQMGVEIRSPSAGAA